MTPDDIAADRAVIDAATGGPGPWTAPGYEVWAAFIAAARTGWPRALDALEAAQERVNELEHRLFPGQGEEYANEVERQRAVIDTMRDALEAAQAEVEQWKRMADRREEALDALGAERNTWARQMADLHDERDDAARAKADAEARMREALDDRDDALNRAEKAEAAIARVRALCDERENSPARGVMFGGDPMPAIVSTDEVRAALDGGDHE